MPPAVRVLVVDDEQLAREGVRKLLEAEPDVTVVAECADGRGALEVLLHDDVDIVFLDVQMPGMNGFEVLQALPGPTLPVVVFITAFDAHAVRAFDANALDYVVKPFSDERLRTAMARARRQVHERRLGKAGTELADLVATLRGVPATREVPGSPAGEAPAAPPVPPATPRGRWADRITVRSVGRVVYVRVADLVWIGSADYYVQLHTVDGKSHLVRESMQRIEERLDPARFTRVHRTAIVNLDQVVEIRTDSAERQFVVLRNGVKLPLGKARRDALERVLANR
jgi:two-component system LytT family response regulator